MSRRTREQFTAQEKVAILRLHLLEHVPASDLCDQHGIHPTMFYRWQKEFFENGSAALEPRSRGPGDSKDRQIALLEQKLQRKHEVLSELMEEPIKLKKELGELGKERGSPRPLVMRSSSSSDAGPMAGDYPEQIQPLEPTARDPQPAQRPPPAPLLAGGLGEGRHPGVS